MTTPPNRLWRKKYALPGEHGAWIWWLGPLITGSAAAGKPTPVLGLLTLALLAAFLLRHPSTILVKTFAGRKPHQDRIPALFWTLLYSMIAGAAVAGLAATGHERLLLLGLPGLPVFLWHLWLVSRREERGQPGVEIVAAGVLALAAPAGYWVSGGGTDSIAWLLWILTWLQSAGSIVLVHLRLQQRRLVAVPPTRERLRMGARTLGYFVFNLFSSASLALLQWVPPGVALAFAVQFVDAVLGVLRPAVGQRPTAIGFRQLAVSILFVGMMAAAYLA